MPGFNDQIGLSIGKENAALVEVYRVDSLTESNKLLMLEPQHQIIVNQANTLAVLALSNIESRFFKQYEWFTGSHSQLV